MYPLVPRSRAPVGQARDLSILKRMTTGTTKDGVGERRQITFWAIEDEIPAKKKKLVM